ncbi:visual pigment-like receptor peropsin isoform X1 [Centruroides sculpturatus]|uniref:visual pigment-like receptor peropsin isoform X1 n=1 Tax=Centruroides sculpturatus TaxID=218467 RepID=UPI000C6D6995|nr:visual pigment-like receptor peropsin isoform X1 [Centruroides sculpturatus]
MNDIDVISDYPNEDQKDVMESNPFLPCTHYIIGVYLLVIGILGTFGNGIIIATFFRFRILLSPTTTLLINLAIADLGICLFGFPFSSSSSFANKWLYGDGGCQWYAFMGFLFGSAHIATLVALGLDRYFVLCNLNTRRRLIFRRYYLMIIVIWIYALFWSVMPLLGWGRYNLEPSLTTCTIDWRHNDTSYKSFLSTYFIFGYVIPCIIIATSYFIATKRIKSDKITITDISIPIRDRWDNERHMTLVSEKVEHLRIENVEEHPSISFVQLKQETEEETDKIEEREELIIPLQKSKKRKVTENSENNETNQFFKKITDKPIGYQDEHTIYGQSIASRIRNLGNKYCQALARNKIDNAIFEIEMLMFK